MATKKSKRKKTKTKAQNKKKNQKKKVKNNRNSSANNDLRLNGPPPDYSRLAIRKNAPRPAGKGSFYWDHLINKLDEGDEFSSTKKEINAFCNRARTLGFIVVVNKLSEDVWNVWFGGRR